jgi:hypothetical protein
VGASKPLLLIDVDGVLFPYGTTDGRGAQVFGTGYERFQYIGPDTSAGDEPRWVWLNRVHGPALLALRDAFDLVWCTSWTRKANEFIASTIGLPGLPLVDLDSPEYSGFRPDDDMFTRMLVKARAVVDYAAGRPFCWIDDLVDRRVDRYVSARSGVGPNLLLCVEPTVGLTQGDLDEARAWAENNFTSHAAAAAPK